MPCAARHENGQTLPGMKFLRILPGCPEGAREWCIFLLCVCPAKPPLPGCGNGKAGPGLPERNNPMRTFHAALALNVRFLKGWYHILLHLSSPWSEKFSAPGEGALKNYPAMTASISAGVLAMAAERFSQPVSVTRQLSSNRKPIPHSS